MDWLGLNAAALEAEKAEGGHGRRVVRVFHPDGKQELWLGTFGGAPVEVGPPAWQFSDGSIVTL